ncbi:kelch repeat and BTB domain-containing protein 7-like [Phyllobates terribilis]|uniref:kelch repeat and BTB domain-containing protein 7-like n=1 Tax=Phyllobates terribilis TaxID=111132 RepID=UPI003CCA9E42
MSGYGVSSFFSGPELLEDPAHASALLAQLKSFYDASLLCDVTIRVLGGSPEEPGGAQDPDNSRSFQCNRNVLSAACPYFRSMFTGGLYESKQQQVTLHDMSPESMALIIEYCYTGKVTVTEANVQRLYAAADMLQLEYVRQACAGYLARRLDLHNCAAILRFADTFDHCELRSRALAFMARHFEQFVASEEFGEMSLAQLRMVLSMDNLDVGSERTVCGAALRWLEANHKDRADMCQEVLSCVRWQHLTDKDQAYVESLRARPWVRRHCLPYLDAVLQDKDGKSSVAVQETSPMRRIGMLAKEMVIFFGHRKEPFLCYDPYSGDIYTMPSPLSNLAHGKAVTSSAVCVSPENDLYLATQPLKQLWVYSPVQNSWQLLAERLLCREGMDVAYLNGYVYIVGGHDPSSGAKIKDVECYSVQRNQWTLVAPLPHSLYSFELVTVNDRLYAISNKRMLCYDPSCNQWLNCASMKRCDFHEACVYNDEIYCICDIPIVKVYNPARGEWRRISPIPSEVNTNNYQIVLYGSKLLLISCTIVQWKKNRVTVHEYDVTNDRWLNIGTMLGLLHYDCGFMCLSARVYPSCLESGQSYITEEDDVRSESSTDWMDGFSELDSESDSLSSFSEDEWPRVSAAIPRIYLEGSF